MPHSADVESGRSRWLLGIIPCFRLVCQPVHVMVTSSGYVLLAALLPWMVCSVRGILEPEGSDPEEVPKDEDRLECLRQDNLDLVGDADFARRYILRQVVGVNEDDTNSDIYLFADKFRISRVQAELKLSRTGADALAFELVGSNSTEKHTGLGSADMRIREFQLVTQSSVISCATSLASRIASDCDDPEEQQATVLFQLAGTIRAKKHKGRWEADIVTKEVRYFSFGFQNKKVLAFALSWLPSPIEDEIKNQLFELVETTIPINLLASLQFLPREDHWLTGSMKLLGNMTEANGPLKVWSSLDFTAHTVPARIPGILNKTFTVEELATALLSDPKLARALSNLIENLPQFRYVIGDRLKSVMEEVNYKSSRSARMEQVRKISRELSVQFLQPFLKAHMVGTKAADLRGLNAHLGGGVSWNASDNGLARASFHPKELKLRAGSGEDGNPLYSLAQAPLGLLEELALNELLPKLPAEGELAEVEFKALEYNSNDISLALAAIRNWAQKPDASMNSTAKWQVIVAEAKAIALRLPQALSLPFAISCMGGKITIDHSGRIQLLSGRSGVEVSQTRPMYRPVREGAQRVSGSGQLGDEGWDKRLPTEFQRPTSSQLDMTVVDGIDQVAGSVSLDVVGEAKGSLQIKIGGTLQMTLDVKSVMASALAGLPTEDFGYAFFADEFEFYKSDYQSRQVMAVLSCGYLRLLEWPLRIEPLKRLDMNSGQRQYDLTKLRGYPTLEKDPQLGTCLVVHYTKEDCFFSCDKTERLCGEADKAEALYKAIKLQMHRFEHGMKVHESQAVKWRFGTHVVGKPHFVLPQDTVQANLQTVMKMHTWSKTRGGSSHPALLEAAAASRISSFVAEGSEVAIARHANTVEEERRMETPTEKGSFESKACRAQEELDSIRYPPEKYGNASMRMVIPATPIGDVHLLIEKIQVVSFDIVGSLVRNSDTTFSFELGGSDGPGTVDIYVQGIKFKAPDSALPGIAKAASADSLEEGPLKATLKMKGEFKLSEGAFVYLGSQLNLVFPPYPAFPMSRWFQHPCSKSASGFILFALQLAVLASANQWTLLFPLGTPAARSGHTMVWDPGADDGGFWMFGGELLLSIKSNNLYFYNAASNLWTQKASGPAARYRHSAVLDPTARTLYIFAGTNLASAGNTFNDLHLYDVQLDSWTELTGTAGRSRHTAVWDSTSDRMIVFGGLDNMLNKLNSLAEYDRVTDSWSSPAAAGPVARDGHVAVWDPATGSMLMCCGASSAATLGDLWSYNGAWSQLAPSGSITARRYASAVWDPQAGALLGFAGSGGSRLDSLFLYSASANSWSEYTETGPPAQDRGAVAWDPVNGRLYAFGGYYKDNWLGLLGSLWRFDASPTSTTSTSSADVHHTKHRFINLHILDLQILYLHECIFHIFHRNEFDNYIRNHYCHYRHADDNNPDIFNSFDLNSHVRDFVFHFSDDVDCNRHFRDNLFHQPNMDLLLTDLDRSEEEVARQLVAQLGNSSNSTGILGSLLTQSDLATTQTLALDSVTISSQSRNITVLSENATVEVPAGVVAQAASAASVGSGLVVLSISVGSSELRGGFDGASGAAEGGSAQCAFWDEETSAWSSTGLRRLAYQDGELICQTSHLTVFGAVLDVLLQVIRCSTASQVLSAEGFANFGKGTWTGRSPTVVAFIAVFVFVLLLFYALRLDAKRALSREEVEAALLVELEEDTPREFDNSDEEEAE
ncbi:rngB, partial [Symbiodinium sp. CCMP2456]